MELIQFFNRVTGTWGERLDLTAGYSESWVLDKTTDSAKDLKFELETDVRPTYAPNDWCRLLHVDEKNRNAAMTYDSYGRPTNSTQYLIKDIRSTRDENNNLWITSLTLKEVIERFNGVLGETLSYTNQTSKTFNDVTYRKAAYNCYTALRRWLLVTPANCDKYKYLEVGENLNGVKMYLTFKASAVTTSYSIAFTSGATLTVVLTNTETAFSLTGGGANNFTKSLDSTNSSYSITFDNTIGSVETVGAGYDTFKDTFTIFDEYQRLTSNVSWYNRIKILDEEWLKGITYSDTTLNELTLCGLLLTSDQSFDSLTGRTPVAYFDINPATDLPYNLDRDEYILKFERQDGFDKPIIEFEELKANNIGYDVTYESSNYATGLVCNAENISASAVVNFPAQNLYAVPEVNDDSRGTTDNGEGSDWIIRFPHPIKRVYKLVKYEIYTHEYYKSPPPFEYRTIRKITDITTNTLEKKQYLAADPNGNPTENNSYNWYEEGGTVLHIKSMWYTPAVVSQSGEPANYVTIYYIEYDPLVSARLMFGSAEYQTQINQSASQIDASKFGKFASQYLNGMNKADITTGKNYENYSEFKDIIGSRVKDGNKMYMVTQVAYKNIGVAGYNVFMQLNENHMRKNNAYTTPQNIQKNTAIATSNIKNRQTAIMQTVIVGFTTKVIDEAATTNSFLTDVKIALSALAPNQIDSKYYPQLALFTGYSSLMTYIGNIVNYEVKKLANVAAFQTDKQINLNVTYYDNADAGKIKTGTLVDATVGTETFKVISKIQNQVPTLYSDPFGEAQKIKLCLSSITSSELTEISTSSTTDKTEFDKTINVYQRMANLPNLDSATETEVLNNASIETNFITYLKDVLEKININVIINYEAVDCIVCNSLMALSRLLNQTDNHTLKVYFYDTYKNEDDDLTGYTASRTITGFDLSYDNIITLYINSSISNMQGKTLVITTNDDKKLLIYNNISSQNAYYLANSMINIYYA